MTRLDYRFLPEAHDPINIRVYQAADGLIRRVDAGEGEFDTEVTSLGFRQCQHCPLKSEESPTCPLAVVVCPVIKRFQSLASYTPARVLVKTNARNYHKAVTIQGGLSSLLGLLMGGSGCPYMAFFRPMAKFHLPFSTEEETVYRAIANTALTAYFSRTETRPIDEVTLVTDVYRDIQILNQGISSRLQYMTQSDATNNAVVLLDMFAKLLGSYLEDGMASVRALYRPSDD